MISPDFSRKVVNSMLSSVVIFGLLKPTEFKKNPELIKDRNQLSRHEGMPLEGGLVPDGNKTAEVLFAFLESEDNLWENVGIERGLEGFLRYNKNQVVVLKEDIDGFGVKVEFSDPVVQNCENGCLYYLSAKKPDILNYLRDVVSMFPDAKVEVVLETAILVDSSVVADNSDATGFDRLNVDLGDNVLSQSEVVSFDLPELNGTKEIVVRVTDKNTEEVEYYSFFVSVGR